MELKNKRNIVKVKRRNNLDIDTDINEIKINELIKPASSDEDSFVGTLHNTRSGKIVVLNFDSNYIVEGRNKGRLYNVQFLKTGYFTVASKSNVKAGTIFDPYHRGVKGVGYYGNYEIVNDIDTCLLNTWRAMISRCYYKKDKQYKFYGERGVKVSSRWHSFENFAEDVKMLPNWQPKTKEPLNYQLDKDYYAANLYSKDTCVWIHKVDNHLYTCDKSKPFYIIDGNHKEMYISIRECAKQYGIISTGISTCLSGKTEKYKNYTFEHIDYDKEKYVYRYEL